MINEIYEYNTNTNTYFVFFHLYLHKYNTNIFCLFNIFLKIIESIEY